MKYLSIVILFVIGCETNTDTHYTDAGTAESALDAGPGVEWVLGDASLSCDVVCDRDTHELTYWPTVAECEAVLASFGYPVTVTDSPYHGLGCHLDADGAGKLSDVGSLFIWMEGCRRACACGTGV